MDRDNVEIFDVLIKCVAFIRGSFELDGEWWVWRFEGGSGMVQNLRSKRRYEDNDSLALE